MDFFEAVIKGNSERDPQKIVNWIETELLRCLNEYDLHAAESLMDPGTLGELCDFMSNGTISSKIGKKIMSEIFSGDTRTIQEVRDNFICSDVTFHF